MFFGISLLRREKAKSALAAVTRVEHFNNKHILTEIDETAPSIIKAYGLQLFSDDGSTKDPVRKAMRMIRREFRQSLLQ